MLIKAVHNDGFGTVHSVDSIVSQVLKRKVHGAGQVLLCVDRAREYIDNQRSLPGEIQSRVDINALHVLHLPPATTLSC